MRIHILSLNTPNIPSHHKILNIPPIMDLPIILLLRITSLKTNNLARKPTSPPHHTKLVKLRWPSFLIHTQHLFHYTDNCWFLDFLLVGRDCPVALKSPCTQHKYTFKNCLINKFPGFVSYIVFYHNLFSTLADIPENVAVFSHKLIYLQN